MRKCKHIMQHDEIDCGAACFAMICDYHDLKITVAEARKLVHTDRMGTNIYGILQGAQSVGLKADALEGDYEELIEDIESGDIKHPFIARILTEELLEHYIVVYSKNKNKMVIGDPADYRKTSISLEQFSKRWLGDIIVFKETDEFKTGDYTKHLFNRYFRYLKDYKKTIVLAFIVSLIVTAIHLGGSIIFEYVLDNVADTNGFKGNLLMIVCISFIVLYIFGAGIGILESWFMTSLSKRIGISLSSDMFNHMLDTQPSQLNVMTSGDFLSRFNDLEHVKYIVSTLFFSTLIDVVMTIGCGCMLFYISRELFLLIVIVLLLYIFVEEIFRRPLKRVSFETMKQETKTLSFIKESIDGILTLKSYVFEKSAKKKMKGLYENLERKRVRHDLLQSAQEHLVSMLVLICTVGILWRGAYLCVCGVLSVGELMTFFYLTNYFFSPIERLISMQPYVQEAMAAGDRLNDVFALELEGKEKDKKKFQFSDEIKFEDVSFRYGSRKLIFEHLNMTIKSGQKVAIVGKSGSGKTTLARILMMFDEIEDGHVFIDGVPLGEYDLKSLRSGISYISQDTFLMTDTVYNNIRMGDTSISDEMVIEACEKAMADSFIRELPIGYDSIIEENGKNLSSGQRQRLSIARALAHKPQILIMDEATSNLDSVTEKGIINLVDNLKDTTCIIIAHRLHTIKKCDYIYFIGQGHVLEEGTHDSLLEKEGIYASLWK